MSYFTGTANNPSDLKSLVETKAVLAGWTLTSGWLSKTTNHIQVTAPDGNFLHITGANSSDGATQPASQYRSICIQTIHWPITYYLFLLPNPDMVILVVKYATNRIQYIMFGNIVKIADAAFVGGNFYSGTSNQDGLTTSFQGPSQYVDGGLLRSITNDTILCSNGFFRNYTAPCIIPFTSKYDTTQTDGHVFHAEIDGAVWTQDAAASTKISYTDTTISSLFRSPNIYNSQTHLVPMNLQYSMTDNYYGYLGYIEHVRLVRVDNYEIGDIISISPDNWMVFPWRIKSTVYRDGNSSGNPAVPGISGTLGFAVRYTP